MKISLTISLLLCSAVALALPTDRMETPTDSVTGLKLPHFYDEIDLDEYEAWMKSGANDTDFGDLIKRTQVQVCSYTTVQGGCITFGEYQIEGACSQIAGRFYDASQNDNCNHFTGAYQKLNWDQHASNKDPSNNDCTTTAEVGTINGALQNYFRKTDDGTCGVKCLQLSHGSGTWRGYVSIGVSGYTASDYACGPHSANVCYKGGKYNCSGNNCGASPN